MLYVHKIVKHIYNIYYTFTLQKVEKPYIDPIPLPPAACPAISTTSSYLVTCDVPGSYYDVSAMLRLYGGSALIFTPTNKYYWCEDATNIVTRLSQDCIGPFDVGSDAELGADFASGAPEAGVAHMEVAAADCRYYLTKGVHTYLVFLDEY